MKGHVYRRICRLLESLETARSCAVCWRPTRNRPPIVLKVQGLGSPYISHQTVDVGLVDCTTNSGWTRPLPEWAEGRLDTPQGALYIGQPDSGAAGPAPEEYLGRVCNWQRGYIARAALPRHVVDAAWYLGWRELADDYADPVVPVTVAMPTVQGWLGDQPVYQRADGSYVAARSGYLELIPVH